MQVTEIFPWNDNFATGIEIVDSQHRKLVDLINIFTSHLAYESDDTTIQRTFSELADYAGYHFHTEEVLWHKHLAGDEWEAEHLQSHQEFIATISNLKAKGNHQNPEKLISETLSFLTNWLAFHILESDMCMAKFVRAREQGKSITEAKIQAREEMNGAAMILLNAILRMYDTLSHRTIQMVSEIAKRQRAENKLLLAKDVFDNTIDSICITDNNALIVDANPSFLESTGLPSDKIIGKELHVIKSGFEYQGQSAQIWKSVNDHGSWNGEFKTRDPRGEVESEWLRVSSVKSDSGKVINYVLVFSNLSNLLDRQKSLERIAGHDALTDLPNRLLLTDRLELGLARAQRNREYLALCFLDLDGFKQVNDRFGHAAGDTLLIELARRLKKLVRNSDTVARVGGDEFVIVITDLKKPQNAAILLDRILGCIAAPIQLEGDSVQVTATIGVALYPNDAQDVESLMKLADQTMYQCKHSGKARYRFATSVSLDKSST
jgi:diguanylate cyclase (GGDEF)-like protein/hemerythrin-like metal-binding protein/PAS domain S-box-containing protein